MAETDVEEGAWTAVLASRVVLGSVVVGSPLPWTTWSSSPSPSFSRWRSPGASSGSSETKNKSGSAPAEG